MKRLLPAFAGFLGLGVLGGLAFLLSTRRLVVEGRSMEPTYRPGDRLLANKLAYVRAAPRVGDVVIVRRPGEKQGLHIKRITAAPGEEVESEGERRRLGPDEWWVLGDNPRESTDSRQLGPVRRRQIEGKVVLKY